MNNTTTPRWYIADAGRGYAVIASNGDGEYDWFPTYDEAVEQLDRLNSADEDDES